MFKKILFFTSFISTLLLGFFGANQSSILGADIYRPAIDFNNLPSLGVVGTSTLNNVTITGTCTGCGSGGGGSSTTIDYQNVAYATATNTLGGDAAFKFDPSTKFLKIGSSIGTNDAPLHVRANASKIMVLQGGSTFPFYLSTRNALADEMSRIDFRTDSGRGGEISFWMKPSDATSGSTPVKKVKIDANGYLGLGVVNTIPEILSYKNVSATNFTNSGTGFFNGGVETIDVATTTLFSRTLNDNFTHNFDFKILVRRDDGGFTQNASWHYEVVAYRSGGGAVLASTSTLGVPWALGITDVPDVYVSGNDLKVDVHGEAGKTLDWWISGSYPVLGSSL